MATLGGLCDEELMRCDLTVPRSPLHSVDSGEERFYIEETGPKRRAQFTDWGEVSKF